MRFPVPPKQLRQFLAGKTLDELLDAMDAAPNDPKVDAATARLVADTAANRTMDWALSLGSGEACDALEKLDKARISEGAHALPSWEVRVTALTRALADRHPGSAKAMAEWEQGLRPDHDSPIGALVEAVREAIADRPL